MYIEITIKVANDRYHSHQSTSASRQAELDLPDVTKLDIPTLASELTREAIESYHNGGDKKDSTEA